MANNGRLPMVATKRAMLLALARGANQTDDTLQATIHGFFPGETLDTIINEESEVVMNYLREMMITNKRG